jgi:hypothetical protein
MRFVTGLEMVPFWCQSLMEERLTWNATIESVSMGISPVNLSHRSSKPAQRRGRLGIEPAYPRRPDFFRWMRNPINTERQKNGSPGRKDSFPPLRTSLERFDLWDGISPSCRTDKSLERS